MLGCVAQKKKRFYIYLFFSKEYISSDPPRVVLNKMDWIGYKVIASTGVGQTIVWTLYKPDEETSDKEKPADRWMVITYTLHLSRPFFVRGGEGGEYKIGF